MKTDILKTEFGIELQNKWKKFWKEIHKMEKILEQDVIIKNTRIFHFIKEEVKNEINSFYYKINNSLEKYIGIEYSTQRNRNERDIKKYIKFILNNTKINDKPLIYFLNQSLESKIGPVLKNYIKGMELNAYSISFFYNNYTESEYSNDTICLNHLIYYLVYDKFNDELWKNDENYILFFDMRDDYVNNHPYLMEKNWKLRCEWNDYCNLQITIYFNNKHELEEQVEKLNKLYAKL